MVASLSLASDSLSCVSFSSCDARWRSVGSLLRACSRKLARALLGLVSGRLVALDLLASLARSFRGSGAVLGYLRLLGAGLAQLRLESAHLGRRGRTVLATVIKVHKPGHGDKFRDPFHCTHQDFIGNFESGIQGGVGRLPEAVIRHDNNGIGNIAQSFKTCASIFHPDRPLQP